MPASTSFTPPSTAGSGSRSRGAARPLRYQPGELVDDAYRILDLMAEGGFGLVYLAERLDPPRERLALKVIKPGMDSRAVLARFDAERDALERMNHPNIARVLGSGATDAGQPYFVMEWVRGPTITAYADAAQLSIEQRIRLFIHVCDAVHHAHTRGVLHRDLKPSNILVAADDRDEPTPKVIDFGVAKALATRSNQQTLMTEQGQLMGTPDYMSPEQADFALYDIDTRTDVYSLGVVLYELLTGELPFDEEVMRRTGVTGIQRILREDAPPRMSARVRSAARNDPLAVQTALDRGLEPDDLVRALAADLDWIVAKCLEKDRERRYASALTLKEDLERFLERQPVLAGPPGLVYRTKKFVQRRKFTVAVAATLLAAASVLGAVELNARLEVQAADAERARQAAITQQVASHLMDTMLDALDDERLGPDARLEDLYTVTFEQFAADGLDDPVLEAAILQRYASAFFDMELLDAMDRANQLAEAAIHEADPDDVPVELRVGLTISRSNIPQRRDDWEASKPLLLQALREAETGGLDRDHRHWSTIYNNLGYGYERAGELDKGLHWLERAAEHRVRVFGASDPATILIRANIVSALAKRSAAEALDYADRHLQDVRRAPIGAVPRLRFEVNRAGALSRLGRHEERVTVLEEILPVVREQTGPTSRGTVATAGSLADAWLSLGDYERAATIAERTLRDLDSDPSPTDDFPRRELHTLNVLVRASVIAGDNATARDHLARSERLIASGRISSEDVKSFRNRVAEAIAMINKRAK